MMLPAIQENGPGDIPINILFRATGVLISSFGLMVLPCFFSQFRVSRISLYTAKETGSLWLPFEFVWATTSRAKSWWPWWTNQRGDSGLHDSQNLSLFVLPNHSHKRYHNDTGEREYTLEQ